MSRAPLLHSGLVALLVLLLALVLGTGLRVYAQNESPNVQHDEAWSYASAAGRLGPFLAAMNGGLTGRWVPAGEWQYYWQSDRLGDFTHIGPDLAAYDVHPPLYFGLLFTGAPIDGFYRKLGWKTISNQHASLNEKGERVLSDPQSKGITMIYPGRWTLEEWPDGLVDLNGRDW